MIIFDNVTKTYGKTKVLDQLNLEISAGDFICMAGPSGAGKTTLVHALIGAEKVNKGHIKVDEYRVNHMNPNALQLFRRKVGMVFQDYKLLPQKTVFENVAFALEVCGYEDHEIKKRVNKVLEMVGLGHRKKNFPRQLSGGEKQRTAIARAMVHSPLILIADEPTGNLDFDTALEIIKLLIEINKIGTTILLTTHNRELIEHIPKCRLVTLNEGRITKDRLKQ